MSDPLVRVDEQSGIARVVLNSPATLNALSIPLLKALDEAVDQLVDTDRLRCLILTGEGRAFCAGGDLAAFKSDIDAGQYHRFLARLECAQRVFNRIERLPVPVIGAVNGVAVAGGLELLLCCDILYAARSARIGDGHARYGVIPAGGASVRLPARIADGPAREMLLTGELYQADQLARWGLVNRVVPDSELEDAVLALARTLCRNSPAGLAHIKTLARENLQRSPEQGLRAEIDTFTRYARHPDFREGLAAFAEKRAPVFEGTGGKGQG
ncbi:enoyl-CoA hydratase/isomerase family protein [Alloalcanivorax sp. C16-1]|uniref:enoyl-CoA hydratase/isomerase family protein n=1 Tax=Alloalcanivorax sp. C16-1 TaxID=3390051 RepID=UPI003970FB9E